MHKVGLLRVRPSCSMSSMACGSCGRRKKVEGEPPLGTVGPGSKLVFYAVDPAGNGTAYRTLMEARAAARKGGNGWSVEGRREKVD